MTDRIQNIYIAILFLAILLPGCGHRHAHHDSRLDIPDCVMNSRPDSVLIQLKKINPSALHSDYDRALLTLLMTMARDKCYETIKPDSALTAAAECFHRQKDFLNEAKARYYAGWAQCQAADYQAAIWEALHAIDLAHEAADTFWMGRAHDLAGEIYLASYDTHNAAVEADKAAYYFKKAGNIPFHRYSLFMKMSALSYPRNIDGTQVKDGDSLLDSLISVFKADSDSLMIAECLNKKARKFATYKDFESCKIAIDSMRLYSKSVYLNNAVLPFLISSGLNKGEDVDNLIEEFNSLKRSTIFDTLSYLQYKKDWFTQQNNLNRVNTTADSIIFYYTRILGEKTNKSIESVRSDFYAMISDNKERENNELKSHNFKLGILIIFILLAALVISSGVLAYLRHKKTEFMNRLLDVSSENDSLNNSIKQREGLYEEMLKYNEVILEKVRKENESLKLNIRLQNKVITDNNKSIEAYKSAMESVGEENESLKEKIERIEDAEARYIMNISPKSSLLGNRLDTIFNLVTDFFDERKPETSKNIIYSNAVKEVDVIRSEKFLNDFVEEIESRHDNILSRLKKQLPSIKDGDLIWIAMIVGGVTPLAICFILQMKSSTLYSKRRRLRVLIKHSSCVDKNEFLAIFGENKDR